MTNPVQNLCKNMWASLRKTVWESYPQIVEKRVLHKTECKNTTFPRPSGKVFPLVLHTILQRKTASFAQFPQPLLLLLLNI